MLIGDSVFDLFLLIATLCEHDHGTRIMEANIILQRYIFDIRHHELMLSVIVKIVLQAIRFTLVGDRRQRNAHVIDDQDDIRPLVTDDKSFAVIELLGVFRMQTGTLLERAVNEHGHFPGQTFEVVQRAVAANTKAFERILGVHEGSLTLTDQKTLRFWFG